MTYTLDLDRIDLDVVHGWISRSYWADGRTREQTDEVAAHSVNVGALDDDGSTVGYARLVTDRVSFGWLSDVFVHPDWRGHGIASGVVRTLLDHVEPWRLRRVLLSTRDAQPVYAPLGFGPLANPERFMQVPAAGPVDAGSS